MKLFKASCHCKNTEFEFKWDVKDGIHKCNCTYCVKTKYQKIFTKFDNLKITNGEKDLRVYHAKKSAWPEGHIHHYFCNNCGVQVFSKGFLEMGKEPFTGWFYAVNLATADNISPEEIISSPVIFEDGLNDDQLNPPKETRHL